MILAGIMDYVHWWQVFPALVFLAAWLIGGPYLTRRALARAGLPPSRRRMGLCMKANFLTIAAGLVAAGIVALFAATLAMTETVGPGRWRHALLLAGAMAALAAMFGMSWAVLAAMVDLSGRALRRVVYSTTAPLVGALAVCSVVSFIPARIIREGHRQRANCHARLSAIGQAAREYRAKYAPNEAPWIEALVEEGLLRDEYMYCPSRGTGDCGYLYVPVAPPPPGARGAAKDRLRACDRRGNHGDVRMVLYHDGRVGAMSEADFQKLMGLEINAAIAAKDRADP